MNNDPAGDALARGAGEATLRIAIGDGSLEAALQQQDGPAVDTFLRSIDTVVQDLLDLREVVVLERAKWSEEVQK